MPFLYASIIGFMSWMGEKLKPSAPMPCWPAFSNVGGFPQATQMGGCTPRYGLGRILWGLSTAKWLPWNVYDSVSHIFGISQTTSSHSARVDDVSWMLKVAV